MPAPLAVDWNEVKTLALAIGVREAARQMGIEEDTVLQRSYREGWLRTQEADRIKMEAARAKLRERQGLSSNVITAADALRFTGQDTRAKLAIGLNSGANHIATMDGQEIVMSAQQVATLAKAASIVHDWPKSVQLNVLSDVLADPDSSISEQVIDV